jgi:hypothetical protein
VIVKRVLHFLQVSPPVRIRSGRDEVRSRPAHAKISEFFRLFGALAVVACALEAGSHTAQAQPEGGPSAASALAADDDLSKAIRENNADGIARWLNKEWAVVSAKGGVGEGPSIFPDGIREGVLTRKTFETSEPRVRIYDDVALVTTKVKTSGMFGGKAFDVVERQTDVWLWKDGGWTCVLTHETFIPAKAG